jgi:hypothetical protein
MRAFERASSESPKQLSLTTSHQRENGPSKFARSAGTGVRASRWLTNPRRVRKGQKTLSARRSVIGVPSRPFLLILSSFVCDAFEPRPFSMAFYDRHTHWAARRQTMIVRTRLKARSLHTISWSYFHGLADFEVDNLEALLVASCALHPPSSSHGFGALYPPPGRCGFPAGKAARSDRPEGEGPPSH